MSERYRAPKIVSAATAVLIGGATISGCTGAPSENKPTRPSVNTFPSCGPEGGGTSPYGVDFPIYPDEFSKLLGKDGAAMQAAEWALIKNEFDDVIKAENPPQGTHFVVSAKVGYNTVPKAEAKQEADQLAHLASQELDYPIDDSVNDAYPAQDDDIAALFVTDPDAGAPACTL